MSVDETALSALLKRKQDELERESAVSEAGYRVSERGRAYELLASFQSFVLGGVYIDPESPEDAAPSERYLNFASEEDAAAYSISQYAAKLTNGVRILKEVLGVGAYSGLRCPDHVDEVLWKAGLEIYESARKGHSRKLQSLLSTYCPWTSANPMGQRTSEGSALGRADARAMRTILTESIPRAIWVDNGWMLQVTHRPQQSASDGSEDPQSSPVKVERNRGGRPPKHDDLCEFATLRLSEKPEITRQQILDEWSDRYPDQPRISLDAFDAAMRRRKKRVAAATKKQLNGEPSEAPS